MYRPRPILWQINLPKECPIDIDGGWNKHHKTHIAKLHTIKKWKEQEREREREREEEEEEEEEEEDKWSRFK